MAISPCEINTFFFNCLQSVSFPYLICVLITVLWCAHILPRMTQPIITHWLRVHTWLSNTLEIIICVIKELQFKKRCNNNNPYVLAGNNLLVIIIYVIKELQLQKIMCNNKNLYVLAWNSSLVIFVIYWLLTTYLIYPTRSRPRDMLLMTAGLIHCRSCVGIVDCWLQYAHTCLLFTF